jgi:threonine/homoserine/homoserine lactone efflux protein
VRGGQAFLTGFMTNLLNPKAMLYFSSILSQALSPDLGAADAALLWTLLVGESLLWFSLVAVLFSSQRVLKWLSARLIWFDRAIGVVLLGFAAKLASAALK